MSSELVFRERHCILTTGAQVQYVNYNPSPRFLLQRAEGLNGWGNQSRASDKRREGRRQDRASLLVPGHCQLERIHPRYLANITWNLLFQQK